MARPMGGGWHAMKRNEVRLTDETFVSASGIEAAVWRIPTGGLSGPTSISLPRIRGLEDHKDDVK